MFGSNQTTAAPSNGPSEEVDYDDPSPGTAAPPIQEVEAIVASLIDQGLIKGYISHRLQRVAILRKGGRPNEPDISIGFPQVWTVLRTKALGGNVSQATGPFGAQVSQVPRIPGWVLEEQRAPAFGGGAFGRGGPGPGMVINLSGARPVGSV
jgi:hypothetical protein